MLIYLKKLNQKENMNQIRIFNICQKQSISSSSTVLKGMHLWLLTRGSEVKGAFFYKIKVTRTRWIQSIWKTTFQFELTQITCTKAQSCEKCDSVAVMTIKKTIWRQSNIFDFYIFFENTKTSGTSEIRIQLVPFDNSG